MHKLPDHRRLLLLTEGQLGVFSSKTAAVLLRYRAKDIAGVLDTSAAGRDVREFIPWAPEVPVLPSVVAAKSLQPDALVIGVAPVGGALPDNMRRHVLDALGAGMDIISGLHTFLGDVGEIAALAARHEARIFDLRRPPRAQTVARGAARDTSCLRVLTVGTDCNVGKMVAAAELAEAARGRGLDARMLATGQSGIMIAGAGITIDACVSDFAQGEVESMVLDAADCDVCFVEGQGSIAHPGYSAVTLALMHGACPDAMVLVHQMDRTHLKAPPHTLLPAMDRLIRMYEEVAGLLHPSRVVAIALNSFGHPEDAAREEARRLEAELGLPVADPIRHGCTRLLEAILKDRSA